MAKTLRDLLRSGDVCFGAYIGDTGETVCEIAAYAGFDYLRIDCEHTLMGAGQLKEMLRIADAADIPTLVRTSTYEEMTRCLDFGATGILVPDVSTAEQAREAVRHCKYTPLGERGMTNISRCVKYGGDPFLDYVQGANENICLAVQIESQEGVENIEEIIGVEGVDLVTLGKQDLSQSLGLPGQSSHPAVNAAEEKVVEACLKGGMPLLMTAGTPAQFKSLYERGIRCMTICFDGPFLTKAFRNQLAQFQAVLQDG